MIDSKNISLTFRREDFEEIYFKNNQGDIFWGKPTKQNFIITLLCIAIFIISLSYSLYTNLLWGIPIIFFFLAIISYVSYNIHASPIIKWKKQVKNYLDALAKIKKYELLLTNEALTLIQDDETFITKWATFTKATLTDESITLNGSDTYFFPKKSMNSGDFKYLKELISHILQNGL